MGEKPRAIIVGPTSSGKTEACVKLCQKLGGVILVADSRQVYKELTLSAGKEGQKKKTVLPGLGRRQIREIERVPQFGLDLVSVDRRFTVYDYQTEAKKVLKAFSSLDRPVILSGGTPLYVDAVAYNFHLPKEDLKLRENLEKLSDQELADMLLKLDPKAPEASFSARRRLIRAVEIVMLTQKPLKNRMTEEENLSWLGLNPGREQLYRKIDSRVEKAVSAGMIDEIDGLIKGQKASKERLRTLGLWVRLTVDYLDNKLSREEYLERLKFETHAFARRQLTWWRRKTKISWFEDPEELLNHAKI